MRVPKLLIFPLVSLSLLLICFLLLSFWGYKIFFHNDAVVKNPVSDSTLSSNSTRDSLQKVYSATEGLYLQSKDGGLNTSINPDSANAVDLDPSAFYKLRNEITDLLKSPASNGDLEIAREKIVELQQKILQLHKRNTNIEQENKKLNAVLNQLVKNKATTQHVKRSAVDVIAVKSNSSTAVINDLRVMAVDVNENKEVETTLAEQTEKIVGYFTFKNVNPDVDELFVVVLQPDGHILQNSAWETGTFVTGSGRKAYSCKIKLEGNSREAGHFQFAVNGENFQKGNYIAQIYYDGGVIGRTMKVLL